MAFDFSEDYYTDTSGFLTAAELDDVFLSGQAGQNNLSIESVLEVTALGIASILDIPIYTSETPPDRPSRYSDSNSFKQLQENERRAALYEQELNEYNDRVASARQSFIDQHTAPWLRPGAELRYQDANGVDRPAYFASDNNLMMRHNGEWYQMPLETWDRIGERQLIDGADIDESALLNWDKMLEDSGTLQDRHGPNPSSI